MIKIFKDSTELPDNFTGIFCIGQQIVYSLNGTVYRKNGPAVEKPDGRTKVYKRIPTFNNEPLEGRK